MDGLNLNSIRVLKQCGRAPQPVVAADPVRLTKVATNLYFSSVEILNIFIGGGQLEDIDYRWNCCRRVGAF